MKPKGYEIEHRVSSKNNSLARLEFIQRPTRGVKMYTIAKLLQEFHSKQSNVEHLRFGQWFLNEYGWKLGICPWAQLYYESNPAECVKIIDMWLRDNGYQFKGLPKKAKTKQENTNEIER